MRTLLPVLAAASALIAAPAAAQLHSSASSHSGGHHGSFSDSHDGDDKFRGGRDRFPRRTEVVSVMHSYGGEWALYNNRSWAPDSYNDWWHDRPDRAYPRWLQNNRDCERVWWSGGGWRC